MERLADKETLNEEDRKLRTKFADVFPNDILHVDRLPTNIYHRFKLKDPNVVIARRSYDCPKKYREAWKALLDDHLASGRMRPSSSRMLHHVSSFPRLIPQRPLDGLMTTAS